MTTVEFVTLLGSVVGVGLALAVLIMRTTTRLDRCIDEAAADRRAFQTEAAQDRRAFQTSIDNLPSGDAAPSRAPVQGRGRSRCRLTTPAPAVGPTEATS